MGIDELRRIHRAQPFRPFTIRVADGRKYLVNHPELLAISPTGRTVALYTPDDVFDILGTMMITSVHIGDGRKRARRGK